MLCEIEGWKLTIKAISLREDLLSFQAIWM